MNSPAVCGHGLLVQKYKNVPLLADRGQRAEPTQTRDLHLTLIDISFALSSVPENVHSLCQQQQATMHKTVLLAAYSFLCAGQRLAREFLSKSHSY